MHRPSNAGLADWSNLRKVHATMASTQPQRIAVDSPEFNMRDTSTRAEDVVEQEDCGVP